MTERASLLIHAKRCRELARSTTDARTAATLRGMAQEYEEQAASLQDETEPVNRPPIA